MNDLVDIIKESFNVLAKQRHFVEKYEAVVLLYDLPSLVILVSIIIYQTLHLFSF